MYDVTKDEILKEYENYVILSDDPEWGLVLAYNHEDKVHVVYFNRMLSDAPDTQIKYYADWDSGASFNKEEMKKLYNYLNKFIGEPS